MQVEVRGNDETGEGKYWEGRKKAGLIWIGLERCKSGSGLFLKA